MSSLEPLRDLTRLTSLSFDSNAVADLAPIASCPAMMELHGRANRLERLVDLQPLAALDNLLVLDVAGNGLCGAKDYEHYAVYRLRRLRLLDGQSVSAAAQAIARSKFVGRLTMETLEESAGATDWSRSGARAVVAVRSSPHASRRRDDTAVRAPYKRPEAWCRIEQLDASGLRLRDLGDVFGCATRFAALTELTLAGNLLTSLAPLAGLLELRHLSLDGNHLGARAPECAWEQGPQRDGGDADGAEPLDGAAMSSWLPNGFAPLPNLVVLSLADNRITSIEAMCLTALASLETLFLQGNQISRLAGLSGLNALRELVRFFGARPPSADPPSCRISRRARGDGQPRRRCSTTTASRPLSRRASVACRRCGSYTCAAICCAASRTSRTSRRSRACTSRRIASRRRARWSACRRCRRSPT